MVLLVMVYAFSYVDRQIVTVLAPYLRADLHVTDSQIGLLFGTSFALFYGVFGIPLARLADGWSRVRTLSLGLCLWSLTTALSGLANNFGELGLARIGVGIGEASATPAAVSLLGDFFQRRWRGSILAAYSVGIYIGAGASLMIGGSVVAFWQHHFGSPERAPLGLAGWQAAFLVVGIPGLLLAALITLTVREPRRGVLEGRPQANEPAPFSAAAGEFAAMFPPWNILRMRAGLSARREITHNLLFLFGTIVAVAAVTAGTNALLVPGHRRPLASLLGLQVTTNLIQWGAIGIAAYASASWFQAVRLREPAAHRLITGSRTFRAMILAGAFLAFSMNAVNGFVFVYASRYLHLPPQAGLRLGIIATIAGGAGVASGGLLSDYARRIHPAGRLLFVCATSSIFTAASAVQYLTHSITLFYVAFGVATLFVPMWFGPVQATTQDLVIPRLRGTAFAVFALGPTIFGLGLGPYCVGLISDATGNLRLSIVLALAILPASLVALLYGARHLGHDEAVALSEAHETGFDTFSDAVRLPTSRAPRGRQPTER